MSHGKVITKITIRNATNFFGVSTESKSKKSKKLKVNLRVELTKFKVMTLFEFFVWIRK